MTSLAKQCAELADKLAPIKTELHDMPLKADVVLLLRQLSSLLGQDGLTDERITAIWQECNTPCEENNWTTGSHIFARAIEQERAAPLLARIAELEVRHRIIMGERDDAVRAMEFAQEREQHAKAVAGKLPPSNSPEAQGAIDAVMASRGWPCSPAAAARSGFEAACQVIERLSE